MIEVNCKDGIELVKEEYPCLKKAYSGRIIAFTAPNTGYELKGILGDTAPFLYYSEDWSEEVYKPYTGTVELSNEL